MRQPDFDNIIKILTRKPPSRPTPMEIFINKPLLRSYAGVTLPENADPLDDLRCAIKGFANAGYDYAAVEVPVGSALSFPTGEMHSKESCSMNEGAVITGRESFDRYPWPDPDNGDYSVLDRIAPEIPEGMKLIVFSPAMGLLERTTALVGFENLCMMTLTDESLAADIFDAVGSRLLSYYRHCLAYDAVGAIVGNDDWGFKTQTMMSPDAMRRFVFPWHKRIVKAAHDV